jgi:hypothetical protein
MLKYKQPVQVEWTRFDGVKSYECAIVARDTVKARAASPNHVLVKFADGKTMRVPLSVIKTIV